MCTQSPRALAAAGDRSKSQQGSSLQHGLSWAPVFAQFAGEEVCRLPDQLRLIVPRYALSHLAQLSHDRQTGHFSPGAESAGEKKSPHLQRGCSRGLGGSREEELVDLSSEPSPIPAWQVFCTSGCTEEGSWGWEGVGRRGDSQQGIFPIPKQVSSPAMRRAPRGNAQGSRENQTTETNPGLLQPGFLPLWVPTADSGHVCSTRVPRLLQGSSGRHDTMASRTQRRGSVGLEWSSPALPAWETSLSSQCSQPGLTAASTPPSTASLRPARH